MNIIESLESSMVVYNKDLNYSVLHIDITKKEIEEIMHIAKKIIKENKNQTDCAKAYIKIVQCLKKLDRKILWSKFLLDKALKRLPNNAEAIICKGRVFYDEGKYDDAIDRFDKAINIYYKEQEYENIAYVFCLMAAAYDNKGDYDDAIYYYDIAILLKEDYAFAFLNRGLVHLKKKSYLKARKDYEEVIKLKEEFGHAYDNLAFSYYRELKNNEKVIGYKEREEKINKAISICNKGIEYKPIYPPLYYTLGLISFEENAYDKSLDYFFKYLLCENEKEEYESTFFYIDKIISKLGIDIFWKYTGQKEIIALLGKLYNRYNPNNHYNHFVNVFLFLVNKELLENEFKNLLTTVFDFWRASYQTKKDDDDKTKVIYQYTTTDTLKEMFINKSLRLTPAKYQNDPEEGQSLYKYIKDSSKNKLLTEMLENVIEDNKLNNNVYDERIAFIRSFTGKKDDLEMWRLYGDDGQGVSIGIPTIILSKGDDFFRQEGYYAFDLFSEKYKALKGMPIAKIGLFKVKYISDDEFDKFGKRIIKFLEKIFNKTVLSDSEKPIYREFIELLFLPINHILKNADYKNEDEYRLVYISTINESDKKSESDSAIVNDNNPETGIYIDTEEVLFGRHQTKIALGPKTDDLTYLKYKHSFEHKYNKVSKNGQIIKSVDVSLSKVQYR